MTEETLIPQAETEAEEMTTPESGMRFQRPSRTRKALVSVLGGLGIFAATHAYGVIAGTHNDRIRDNQAEKSQAEAQKARKFDINNRANIAWLIDLDKQKEQNPGNNE